MIARGPTLLRVSSGLLLAGIVTGWTGATAVRAIEPPGPGPLDRPIADLALIDPGNGAGPPLLLTLDVDGAPPGTARVALLDRAAGWEPVASGMVTLAPAEGGAATPWLVELGGGRFVILATAHERRETSLISIRVDPAASTPIEVDRPTQLAMAVDDAGAIDVDGDGTVELVVASASTTRLGGTCQGSELRVLDGASLAQRLAFTVPNLRLAGGVVGEWDDQPGGDLLAYGYGNCPAGPDTAQRLAVVLIRLADGTTSFAVAPGDAAGSLPLPGVPLGADFDADGRVEAVVRDGDALAILDPARDWARTEIARGDTIPIAALAADGSREHGTVAWLERRGEDELAIEVGTVARAADGSFQVTTSELDLGAVSATRRANVLRALGDAAVAQAPSQAWVGDIDVDGCAEILAPLLIAECVGGDDVSMRAGAAWIATRPVAIFDVRDRRELLIAATMHWDPEQGAPRAATPAAIGAPGAWRHGPSVQFALSEIRATDAVYFSTFPVPRPTIERGPVQAQATDLPGFTGVRVLVRATAIDPEADETRAAPGLDAFLHEPTGSRELIDVGRIPVPAGAESGRDGSFLRLPLDDTESPDGLPAARWIVTIAQINDWGEVAGPVRQTIELDLNGPSLVVDTPLLSAPWPFDATLHGRSEPRIEIHGGTGGPVVTDRRGRFELKTQLAPWPQTVELVAVDETGNRTTKRFTLVGGVDYRSLPWGAILAVALLVGAIVSTGRGGRTAGAVETMPDSEPLPEIEELPVAGEWPRA